MDNAKEWQRLTTLYRDKHDEELEELAENFQDLTEVAQQALRDELKLRELSSPEEIRQRKTLPETIVEKSPEEEVPWILRESGNANTLHELRQMLEQAGIEARVVSPQENIYRTQLLQLQVNERDASHAEEIMAAPQTRSAEKAEEEKGEDFVSPACAQCGTPDPLLESVEPFNTWLCENCGSRWVEDSEENHS